MLLRKILIEVLFVRSSAHLPMHSCNADDNSVENLVPSDSKFLSEKTAKSNDQMSQYLKFIFTVLTLTFYLQR